MLEKARIKCYLQKHYSEALQLLDHITKTVDNHVYAWHYKATCLFQLGRIMEAFNDFKKVTSINQNYHPAWNNQGKVHVCLLWVLAKKHYIV